MTPTTTSVNADALIKRYKDAYIVAAVIVSFGTALKILGVVLGILLGFVGYYLVENVFAIRGIFSLVAAGVIGLLIWFLFYVFGVLFSCQGQVLRAGLDGAVYVCPFLNEHDRVAAASLPTNRNA